MGKNYHLDVVDVSSTKRRGSRIVDLDGGWKLFYSGADPSMSAQAGVGIPTSHQLLLSAFDWISLGPQLSNVCRCMPPMLSANIRPSWMMLTMLSRE